MSVSYFHRHVCLLILQTWDFQRIMVYGFRGLVSDFLTSHPGHHINPRRVNRSVFQTLFGQLKHTTGGNLTGHTYGTAKATLLTRRSLHGRKTKDGYRDTPLGLSIWPLHDGRNFFSSSCRFNDSKRFSWSLVPLLVVSLDILSIVDFNVHPEMWYRAVSSFALCV